MSDYPAPIKLEPMAMQLVLEKIRRFDFEPYSDGDLRIALMRLKYRAQDSGRGRDDPQG